MKIIIETYEDFETADIIEYITSVNIAKELIKSLKFENDTEYKQR